MAKENGWWNIEFTTEPNETDLAHIAELIKQGFIAGEICKGEDCEDKDNDD